MTVALREVLALKRRWFTPEPDELYTEIGVRSYGKGIFHKTPISGLDLGTKRVLRLEPGDLVFNNVFAWEGAVAVAGLKEIGMIGSHRFVTFRPKPGRCNVDYLQYYFTHGEGLEIAQRASPGSAGRNRTFGIERFLRQSIVLPPLEEQLRIVATIEYFAAKIEEARQLRLQAVTECAALLKSARRTIIGEGPTDSWKRLGDVIDDIENGWSPACQKHPASDGNWGVIKVGAVSFGTFDPTENKELPPTLEPKPEYELKPGDFLMSRANTRALVGACALINDTPRRLMLCDKIFRFKFKPTGALEARYLDHALKSPALRAQIEAGATGTSPTMKNIAKGKILNLRLPVPELSRQRSIVTYLDGLQSRVDRLKALQQRTAAELDALLPSILDKAFKGEL
ncbi:MAG: hypothetical protein F6K03_01515 [Kamptonema sp. SIO4C4]|nr:hypothetical protein [Kamptonema sp. SIO4C4]